MATKKTVRKVKKAARKKTIAKKPVKKDAAAKAGGARRMTVRKKPVARRKAPASKKRVTEIPVVKSSGSLKSSLSPAKRPTAERAKAAFDGDAELDLNRVDRRGLG